MNPFKLALEAKIAMVRNEALHYRIEGKVASELVEARLLSHLTELLESYNRYHPEPKPHPANFAANIETEQDIREYTGTAHPYDHCNTPTTESTNVL